MTISASKSTSRKDTLISSSQSSHGTGKKIPLRRSKSVSAATRSYPKFMTAPTVSSPSVEQFLNTRDNPLFCSSSASLPEFEASADLLKYNGDCCSTRRGRSVLRSSGNGNGVSPSRVESGGPFRADSREHYENSTKRIDSRSNGHGVSGQRNTLQRWRSCRPVSEHCSASSTGSLEDVISATSLSELEEAAIIVDTWRKNITLPSSNSSIEMHPDTFDVVSDIRTEFETKLKESHERARKLRADLAVEEQRVQEISKILDDINPDERSALRNSQPRRKLSIEKLKMSRRLAEDAMSYFDECVSISTFDSFDFSPMDEQQQPSSVRTFYPYDGNILYSLNDHLSFHEELELQSQCSASAPESSENVKLSLGDTKSCELSEKEAVEDGAFHDLMTYIKRFEKQPRRSHKIAEMSSSFFNLNDFALNNTAESLLLDVVSFRNRIQSGSLLICDIRTFW